MTRVIELNDAALRLADADAILAQSPGYALVDARRLLVGEDARQQARLDPRHTTNQFWHRLSTDPVPHPHPSARSLADLAHAHLLALWEDGAGGAAADEEVIFTLPGTLEREQIALLLGIARECPFRAVGLVDASVAATARRQPDAPAVAHVDALLHEAVVTIVDGNGGGTWQRQRVVDVPNLGLASLREAWINVIADTFVRETRFDPLHDARTEQSLFDRLDDWLDALATRPEVDLELQTSSQVHRVEMTRERLVAKVAPRFALLADAVAGALPQEAAVLVSAALGRLPGLLDALTERLGPGRVTLEVLDADAVVRGTLEHETAIRHDGEALRFVTRLPRTSAPAAPAPTPEPAPTPAAAPAADAAPAVDADGDPDSPTHVLLDHQAWPLGAPRMSLGGPDGVAGDRYPARLGVLEARADGWHLLPEDGAAALPALRPGEARVLGPERALVTLIRVERG